MLKSDLVQTDKHSIKILLRRKNLRFLSRTNLIKTRWQQLKTKKLKNGKYLDYCNSTIFNNHISLLENF